MTDARDPGARFDLDAAFAALARDERVARPVPSDGLVARVLSDAAGVAAGAAVDDRPAVAVPTRRRAATLGGGWLRLFGFGDVWAGATVAAVALVLAMSVVAGYEAGSGMLEMAGLGGSDMLVADVGDDLFGPED
jgi:hypothetical protein